VNRIDHKCDGAPLRAGYEKLIGEGNGALRESEAPADVQDRYNTTADIDNAGNDFRGLRQWGDFNHLHGSFHCRKIQGIMEFIKGKNDELAGRVQKIAPRYESLFHPENPDEKHFV
jgi:hypothetical protein